MKDNFPEADDFTDLNNLDKLKQGLEVNRNKFINELKGNYGMGKKIKENIDTPYTIIKKSKFEKIKDFLIKIIKKLK